MWHEPTTWAFPFFLGVQSQGEHKLNVTRIIEALIIAAVAGGVSMYASQAVMTAEMETVKAAVERIENNQKEMRRDLYRPAVK